MPFWNIRRGTRTGVTDGSAARDAAPSLEPIQVFTADHHIQGWIVATQERVTDVLNQRAILRVCVDATEDRWETISGEDVLLVAPPAYATNQQRRVHRQKHRVKAEIGPYVVTGMAHLQPGTRLDAYLLRTRQPFLPITTAMLTHRARPEFEQALPVVIVNVQNITGLTALLTLA